MSLPDIHTEIQGHLNDAILHVKATTEAGHYGSAGYACCVFVQNVLEVFNGHAVPAPEISGARLFPDLPNGRVSPSRRCAPLTAYGRLGWAGAVHGDPLVPPMVPAPSAQRWTGWWVVQTWRDLDNAGAPNVLAGGHTFLWRPLGGEAYLRTADGAPMGLDMDRHGYMADAYVSTTRPPGEVRCRMGTLMGLHGVREFYSAARVLRPVMSGATLREAVEAPPPSTGRAA